MEKIKHKALFLVCLIATGLMLAAIPTFAVVQVWDLANDFSITNNPMGPNLEWSLGHKSGPTETDLVLYETPSSFGSLVFWNSGGPWNVGNVGKNTSDSVVDFYGHICPPQHCNWHTQSYSYPTIEWTAPSAGKYLVQARCEIGGVMPKTVTMYVLVDGAQVFSGDISSSVLETIFVMPEDVTSKVEFVAGDTFGNNGYYNLTQVEARVTALTGNALVSGTVTENSTGHPALGGATVTATDSSSNVTTATTYSNGNYYLVLAPGTYTIEASAALHTSKSVSLSVAADETKTQDFDLDKSTGTLAGTVTDADGAGVEAVVVSIDSGAFLVATDSSGAYSIDLPVGDHTVAVSAGGYVSQSTTKSISFGVTTPGNFTLAMNPIQDLTADFQMLTNPNGVWTFGKKYPAGTANYPDLHTVFQNTYPFNGGGGSVISFWGYGGNPIIGKNFTDVQGKWWSQLVDPGHLVWGVYPGEYPTIRWKAPATGLVRVYVKDSNLQWSGDYAPATTTVKVFNKPSPDTYTMVYAGTINSTVREAAYVNFVNVTKGEIHDFVLDHDGDINSDETNLELTMRYVSAADYGVISGTVRANTAGNPPIAGAVVTIPSTAFKATADNNGNYSMRVDPGTYNLVASALGYADSAPTSVTVAGGETKTQNFLLDLTSGTVAGVVTVNATGSPGLPDAVISIDGTMTGTTDSNGAYSVPLVSAGSHKVRVLKPRYTSTVYTVNVDIGATTTQNFTVDPTNIVWQDDFEDPTTLPIYIFQSPNIAKIEANEFGDGKMHYVALSGGANRIVVNEPGITDFEMTFISEPFLDWGPAQANNGWCCFVRDPYSSYSYWNLFMDNYSGQLWWSENASWGHRRVTSIPANDMNYTAGWSWHVVSQNNGAMTADVTDGAATHHLEYTTQEVKSGYVGFWAWGDNHNLAYDNLVLTAPPIAPSFSPEPGLYETTQSVTISGMIGATVYYTTDGSDPTTSGTRVEVTGPITIASDTTLKAVAYVGADPTPSSVVTGTYYIQTAVGLSDIKALPENDGVATGEVAVTANFGDSFYVEELTRETGIRVDMPGNTVSVGQKVIVVGNVKTDPANNERYIAASGVSADGTAAVLPLGLNNRALGGGPSGLQQGITGATGVNTIGLLIETTGKVVAPSGDSFSLDDGSGVTVRVTMAGSLPPENAYVSVTGISSCEISGSDLTRLIRGLSWTQLKAP